MTDATTENLTDEEVIAAVDAEIAEANLTEFEKLRRDNPTLADAWEQIKTIRALTEKQQADINARPSWERRYYEIVEGTETDNEALRSAWDKYYVLKSLVRK